MRPALHFVWWHQAYGGETMTYEDNHVANDHRNRILEGMASLSSEDVLTACLSGSTPQLDKASSAFGHSYNALAETHAALLIMSLAMSNGSSKIHDGLPGEENDRLSLNMAYISTTVGTLIQSCLMAATSGLANPTRILARSAVEHMAFFACLAADVEYAREYLSVDTNDEARRIKYHHQLFKPRVLATRLATVLNARGFDNELVMSMKETREANLLPVVSKRARRSDRCCFRCSCPKLR
jgi:hypothetical protein